MKSQGLIDREVSDLLKILQEGPESRTSLVQKMGGSDRWMRRTVEEARLRGHLVIWIDGYYRIASSQEEFREWSEREMKSRLGTLHTQMARMNETAARTWPPQMELAL